MVKKDRYQRFLCLVDRLLDMFLFTSEEDTTLDTVLETKVPVDNFKKCFLLLCDIYKQGLQLPDYIETTDEGGVHLLFTTESGERLILKIQRDSSVKFERIKNKRAIQ